MKKFSDQIDERLKINKDIEINNTFQKINIDNLNKGDELYFVFVDIEKKRPKKTYKDYGNLVLVDNKPTKAICDNPLYLNVRISTSNNICYNIDFKQEIHDISFDITVITSKKMIDYYNKNTNAILLTNYHGHLVILFKNETDGNKFIKDYYSTYKYKILRDYEEYIESQLKK